MSEKIRVSVSRYQPTIESTASVDPKFMNRTVTKIEFPIGAKGEMKQEYLDMINKITNSCYSIKIKYLKPIWSKCGYSIIKGLSEYRPPENKSDKIETNILEHGLINQQNADLVIAGPDQIFHVISFIPLNQEVELGDVFYINLFNSYDSNEQYYVRSKSIKTSSKHVPFDENIFLGSIDVGGMIKGEFITAYTDENNRRRSYSFTRPSFNTVEIVTLDYLCNAEFILKELGLSKIIESMKKS